MSKDRVGIITFYCADNYGAMLQAYGLKQYLCMKGIKAYIVPYEPPFMRGRHWWFPYIPSESLKRCVELMMWGWIWNRRIGREFFKQKRNMNCFRNKYLLEKGHKKLFFTQQMKRLSFPYYIVGSDQIWNPDITCGLRKVYFGAFKNKYKKQVISYAASLGGLSLPTEYDDLFARLLSNIDVISVREEEAIPYIKKFYQGKVVHVLDPVFLLEKEEWKKIEKQPEEEGFVLVYTTEYSEDLYDYAERLSKSAGLKIVELRIQKALNETKQRIDYAAGPAEFLGYLHKADYVVSNSFHAIAFSIIYQKQFAAFVHRTFGARIENILHVCGLESRICQEGKDFEINFEIDWEKVKKKMEKEIRTSERFLQENIPRDAWNFSGME